MKIILINLVSISFILGLGNSTLAEEITPSPKGFILKEVVVENSSVFTKEDGSSRVVMIV